MLDSASGRRPVEKVVYHLVELQKALTHLIRFANVISDLVDGIQGIENLHCLEGVLQSPEDFGIHGAVVGLFYRHAVILQAGKRIGQMWPQFFSRGRSSFLSRPQCRYGC